MSILRLGRPVPAALAWLLLALLLTSAGTDAQGPAASPARARSDYLRDVETWRKDRDTRLRANDGWLTLVGLFWLEKGTHSFGSAKDNALVLPASAPAHVGVLTVTGQMASFKAAAGTDVRLGGVRVTEKQLADDTTPEPDVLTAGTYSFIVIKRGERLGLRVRDTQAAARSHFTGERWFPTTARWRVEARWVPYDTPRVIKIPNIMGEAYDLPSPGYAEFQLGGRTVRLEPVLEEPDAKELFFIFKDATSGHETYPAGRFLYAAMPEHGRVVLDFNKAYNPPCAFSPFATCPLPPPQNRMAVRIEAGAYGYGH